MKRFYLFVLLLATLGCTHYFVRETSEYNLLKEDLEFLQSKKIGLIGFYPFVEKSEHVTSESILHLDLEIKNPAHLKIVEFVNNGQERKIFYNNSKNFIQFTHDEKRRLIKTIMTLDQQVSQTQFLEFGAGSKDLVGKGVNNSISKEKLKEFLSTYLNRIQHLGLDEIESLLAMSETKDKKIQLKNFDIDYWIVGEHSTAFDDNAGDGFKSLVTGFPFILSLGTFPLLNEIAINSTFYVFDKNLDQIAIIQTENMHDSITAWWCIGGIVMGDLKPPTANFYKPNLQQFSKELVKVLKK